MKTFSVRITLGDGTVLQRNLCANSALGLYDQMRTLTRLYPTYVSCEGAMYLTNWEANQIRSQGSLIKEAA